jgi:ABC-2 family transporter protein
VSRLPALTRMALRELFISYRMVPALGLPILAGLAASVVPAEFGGLGALAGAAHLLALGLAVALPIIGAIAAATLASERRRGTLAWMAVRAVPRSAVVIAWFAAFAVLLTAGIFLGATAAWLAALERAETPLDPGPFTVVVASTLAIGLLVIAIGLVLGSLTEPRLAALLTIAVTGAALAWALFGPQVGNQLVTGALSILNGLDIAIRPIGDAVGSAGLSLACAGGLLVIAAASIERADL